MDLDRSTKGVAASALLARHWPKAGSRHRASLALSGVLVRGHWKNAPRFVQLVAKLAGDDEAEARGRDAETTAERHTRGKPATGWPTFVDVFGLDVAGLVQEWLALPGDEDSLHGLDLDGLAGEAAPPAVGLLPLIHIGELYAEPDEVVRWLVEGTLPSGGLSAFVSKPKVGKSTLARCLCAAVAMPGRNWLGKVTDHGAVIYISLEDKKAEVKRHFQTLGVPEDAPLHLFCGRLPADAMAQVDATVREARPTLVVVDGLFRLLRARDSNLYSEMTNRLDPILALARESGAHIVVTHHMKKNSAEVDVQDGVLGSVAISGSVDVTVGLRRERSTGRRVIQTMQRHGVDMPETVLHLEGDDVSLGATRGEDDEHAIQLRILQVLEEAGEPLPREGCDKSIRGLVEGRHEAVTSALAGLVAASRAFRLGTGRKGAPYLYVKADGAEPPDSPPEHDSPPTGARESGGRILGFKPLPSQQVTATETDSPPIPPYSARTGVEGSGGESGHFEVPGEPAAPVGDAPEECPVCHRHDCEGCIPGKKIPADVCRSQGIPHELPAGAVAMSLEKGGECSRCGAGPGWSLAYSDTPTLPICLKCARVGMPPDPFAALNL